MRPSLHAHASALADSVASAAAGDEHAMRPTVEEALEAACNELGITGSRAPSPDVSAHGALIIGYASPCSFRGGRGRAALARARRAAVEYTESLAEAEGRPLTDYAVAVCDGPHLCLGRFSEHGPDWEPVAAFDGKRAQRLLELLASDKPHDRSYADDPPA